MSSRFFGRVRLLEPRLEMSISIASHSRISILKLPFREARDLGLPVFLERPLFSDSGNAKPMIASLVESFRTGGTLRIPDNILAVSRHSAVRSMPVDSRKIALGAIATENASLQIRMRWVSPSP